MRQERRRESHLPKPKARGRQRRLPRSCDTRSSPFRSSNRSPRSKQPCAAASASSVAAVDLPEIRHLGGTLELSLSGPKTLACLGSAGGFRLGAAAQIVHRIQEHLAPGEAPMALEQHFLAIEHTLLHL